MGGVSLILFKVSALCKESGISISRLEKEVGLGNATIWGWETSSPTVEKLRLVADYFRVSIDELIQPDQPSNQDTA
jgi:transcriptional regulator with XRE-family HTH domain